MSSQHAKIALALIDQVRGPYDDQNLQAVLQTKDMLRKIAAGQLRVISPEAPKVPKAPKAKT
jgi:hypothetical protein